MIQEPQGEKEATRVLPASPTMQVIHHMLAQALEEVSDRIEVTWKSSDNSNIFTLTVKSSPVGREPSWQLFQTSKGASRSLWTYQSCDTLLVFNRMIASCGEAIATAHLTAGSPPSIRDAESELESEFFYNPQEKTKQRRTVPLPALANRTDLSKRDTVLNGELAFIQISALLQSILLAKMTGRLQVDSKEGAAEVFFLDGKAVHASTPDASGNESIYELITWQEGKFFFQPQVITQKRTVSDSLDSLVIQGVQLLDKLNLIRNMGFREDSVLAKANEDVSDVDLNTMLSVGEPHLLAAQKELYSALDGKTKFKELAANLKLPRSSWIEILSHLFKCKLVTTDSSSKTLISGKHSLVPKAMDSAAIQSVMMSLRRPDTGMFNYPAFLYFLEQEYFRGHRAGTPVTVIIFEMRVKTGIKDVIREPLPTSALNQAVVRITSAKRHNDLLAHYEGFDYALLCPDTDTEGALIFCERLVKSLSKDPLSPTVKPESLSLSFGIACVPEDFMELGLMLSAAECARTYAVDSNKPVVAFRDMI
ncbi:MAG: DUF4388 domain-containing protein [Cyanobacteriota/Melainabacteria group bacterium]